MFFLIGMMLLFSCAKQQEIDEVTHGERKVEVPIENNFTVDSNYILKDGQPFKVKGVVYVPGYPGFLPWEIEMSTNLLADLKHSIATDISYIKKMGANTIRFWGAPKYCYTALKNEGDLFFIQTIWIDGEVADFQDQQFKENTRAYIREVVDRIYSVFTDRNPPLIAWLVGNELSKSSIKSTNGTHPGIDSFSGNYIKTGKGISASEAFIAEMADYLKTYEFDNYGRASLVSYANDIRTTDLLDTPFLDFRCQNAYSYAVPYYKPGTPKGSSSGTYFQGWIEKVKSKYPDIPLLITETGLSVSPNAHHVGPPNYGYGGNTENEQRDGLLQNLDDIQTAKLPLAGVCIHEYLDAWWKYDLQDSYSQDPNDIEEWFGLARLIKTGNWYETEFRPAYTAIKERWTK